MVTTSPLCQDYSSTKIWKQNAIGHSIMMGPFDNEVKSYAKFLPKLRNIFQIRTDISKYEIVSK